ncbi:MAG: YraN family protein [Longimicrobiales bacterium]
MAESHEFGRSCEALASEYMERKGWHVVARNYRFGRREIDLIAERDGVIAFLEVKGRSGPRFGHPLEAITALKRREIAAVAKHWIARHGRPGASYRFDAIAVVGGPAGSRVEHVEDAWRL